MILVVLIVLGLIFGSFVNALVWRLKGDKDWLRGRSECVHCRHRLAAKDLIPVVSWLMLKGKCRYCHKPISTQYPLIELLTAALFVFSYYFWPLSVHGVGLFTFIIWLPILVGFVALAIFDVKWFLLPNNIAYLLIALALIQLIVVSIWQSETHDLLGALWGIMILAGLFYAIFRISKGKWIGGGDVKLGVLLGLLVGGPLMSVLLLFLASCLGTFFSIPALLQGKAKTNTRVAFGPFLIIATIVVQLFGASIISWYKGLYF